MGLSTEENMYRTKQRNERCSIVVFGSRTFRALDKSIKPSTRQWCRGGAFTLDPRVQHTATVQLCDPTGAAQVQSQCPLGHRGARVIPPLLVLGSIRWVGTRKMALCKVFPVLWLKANVKRQSFGIYLALLLTNSLPKGSQWLKARPS